MLDPDRFGVNLYPGREERLTSAPTPIHRTAYGFPIYEYKPGIKRIYKEFPTEQDYLVEKLHNINVVTMRDRGERPAILPGHWNTGVGNQLYAIDRLKGGGGTLIEDPHKPGQVVRVVRDFSDMLSHYTYGDGRPAVYGDRPIKLFGIQYMDTLHARLTKNIGLKKAIECNIRCDLPRSRGPGELSGAGSIPLERFPVLSSERWEVENGSRYDIQLALSVNKYFLTGTIDYSLMVRKGTGSQREYDVKAIFRGQVEDFFTVKAHKEAHNPFSDSEWNESQSWKNKLFNLPFPYPHVPGTGFHVYGDVERVVEGTYRPITNVDEVLEALGN